MTGKTSLLLGCMALSAAGGVAAPDPGRGGAAGAFLRMGVGGRAMALGGGSAALADDPFTGPANPGGLVFLEGRQVGLMLNSMALDRSLSALAYAQSFRPDPGRGPRADSTAGGAPRRLEAGFSLVWIGAGVDRIDGRDWEGRHTETYSNLENALYFSFAVRPEPAVGLGFSAKLLWSVFPHLTEKGESMTATGVGFDAGAVLRPAPGWTLAVSVHDLRSRYTWDTQKMYERGSQTEARFPVSLRAGAAWTAPGGRVAALCQFEQARDVQASPARALPARLSAGLEIQPVRDLFLRGGMRTGGPCFGFGWRRKVLSRFTRLDYAFVPDPVAPRGSHVFGWSFVF